MGLSSTQEVLRADGKRQCDALSKRTRCRCRGLAIRGKAKCRMHGGRSTGPRTLTAGGRYSQNFLRRYEALLDIWRHAYGPARKADASALLAL